MRPRLGLRPTSPQQDAGIRTEPPPVAAVAPGTEARRQGRSCPSAGAAAGPAQVPGVACGPVQPELGHRPRPQLRRGGAAQDGAACRLHPGDHEMVDLGDVVHEGAGTEGERVTGHRCQVLYRGRRPCQRSRSRLLGLVAGQLRCQQPKGVHLGVQALDPGQIHVHQLEGTHLPAAHGRRLFKRGREGVHH